MGSVFSSSCINCRSTVLSITVAHLTWKTWRWHQPIAELMESDERVLNHPNMTRPRCTPSRSLPITIDTQRGSRPDFDELSFLVPPLSLSVTLANRNLEMIGVQSSWCNALIASCCAAAIVQELNLEMPMYFEPMLDWSGREPGVGWCEISDTEKSGPKVSRTEICKLRHISGAKCNEGRGVNRQI